MPRLFVGIDPPEHVKDQLTDLMGGVIGARWQTDEQLHLTLRFVGEVDRHSAQDTAAALASISHPALHIALDGMGVFDRRGVPQTLWVGVTPQPPIKTLHNKIDQALARVGIARETRAYFPHVTLARLGREAGSLSSFMARHGGFSTPSFHVPDFCLYESQLTREGSIYTILERYPLR
jgi:2'-5' RNA ligase